MPHSVATVTPHCGDTRIERANKAFDVLQEAWSKAAEAARENQWSLKNAREIAVAFRRSLQAHPDLIGLRLAARSIRKCYPLFCRSLGVSRPPPYKDFARELARLTPRKRIEVWRSGKRVDTLTVYVVPDPDAAVVELAIKKRKHT
jgi:hypothetical protein